MCENNDTGNFKIGGNPERLKRKAIDAAIAHVGVVAISGTGDYSEYGDVEMMGDSMWKFSEITNRLI